MDRSKATIHTILEEFREAATSSRNLGDRFERLILTYLRVDPLYGERFDDVWMWMDWPRRGRRQDTGIDLVARERATGRYCAVQCKFYDPSYTLQKSDIDSFFTASGTSEFSSRTIVSTTDRWSKHAIAACENQQIPVTKLLLKDLAESPIDWSEFSLKKPETLKLLPKKSPRPHQKTAIDKVMDGFKTSDRGKLIMACGTGKTYTSLRIAEEFAKDKPAIVLFLVPSIALLSQTLREWTTEASVGMQSIAVCSDAKASKRQSDTEDLSAGDLAYPATTKAKDIADRAGLLISQSGCQMLAIFSTYQSLQAIADAQANFSENSLPEFDLIICDEAHRTTGATVQGTEESYFVRIHDRAFIRGKKRLYMTATPRLYGDAAKTKAQENDIVICSMDDPDIYGREFHRLGFGEAVGKGLLADYRVMVLAVDEKYVSATFQKQLADGNNELNLVDAVRITGCWNGLSKRMREDAQGNDLHGDIQPMRRAVAFSQKIKDSQRVVRLFSEIVDTYQRSHPDEEILRCEVDHVDGTQNVLERHAKLDWLKAETSGNVCRILSNARCLSEGVDVPALDAVMFLTPRGSVVDVVQSVGRVMRLSPGKKYGYIILPVGIPAGVAPEVALKDHEKYKAIWQVLQALRAHDDRFNATINKLELNQTRPPQLEVIGVGSPATDEGETGGNVGSAATATQLSLNFPELEEWRNAIYAKIVQKCGDRQYWEQWAADVAKIADGQIWRIKALLDRAESAPRQAFDAFMAGLHQNINPNVTEDDAIEMLAQHLITKPVFDALFEGYSFTENNPVSIAMQQMLDVLEGESLEKDTVKLTKFYDSVRQRASGIDNAKAKQKIIVELYDKFFRNAFPRMADRLGIVYTPIEVVDFMINSADRALQQEFGVGLTSEGVHVLDPFTGTGTFMVRLLQSGLIRPEDLQRKFGHELHANEIVLLAYYIAAINIEETFHGLTCPHPQPLSQIWERGVKSSKLPPRPKLGEGGWGGEGNYQPFNGIVLTDTFQMFEGSGTLMETMFPENNQRVQKQKQQDIRVIIGNPPYSAGQGSENDGNKNLKYPQLDRRIGETYAKFSSATNKNSLYDSYIRAIRWASDRIKDKGIVCFVSNGSFIDGNALDGVRKCLIDEFSKVYCFNLRGNTRTSGETARREGGQTFGSGSRATIAITLLIKNPEHTGRCKLFYHDIGDYLSREEKLKILQAFGDIAGIEAVKGWTSISPNDSHDWINQRDPAFDAFMSLGDKKDATAKTIFDVYSRGFESRRDAWCYNFSLDVITKNICGMINFYNAQVEKYKSIPGNKPSVENFVDTNPKKISWSRRLKGDLEKLQNHKFNRSSLVKGVYRPYCKQWSYFDSELSDFLGSISKIFPSAKRLHKSIAPLKNIAICVTGEGSGKDFSVLITNVVPNLHLQGASTACQFFPLYTYTQQTDLGTLFATANQPEYIRNENIPNAILTEFQTTHNDPKITKEDIFYYVYGILHSQEYKTRFAADLKKMLPRIPHAADFWAFSTAGRNLAHWHLNYETIEPYPLDEYKDSLFVEDQDYRVQKMSFGRKDRQIDKTTIIYNSKVKLAGIPLEAYDYKVCDRAAIEWIMERYQVTEDKASGIVNDPNDWSDDPHYIIDLVKRIVRVSLETVKIVNSLPPLND